MSGIVKAVAGVVLVAAGLYFHVPWLTKAGAALLLSSAAEMLMPSPGRPPLSPVDVAYSGTLEPRRILYGQMKISGMHTIPPTTSGPNNDFFHLVLTLAGHRFDNIGDVYFNQTRIDTADISAVAGVAGDGLVKNLVTLNGVQGVTWIRRYDGSQTAVDYILNTSVPVWDASHVGYNIPNIAITLQYQPSVFTSGLPTVTAMCRGKRVYDPRLDSTNGGVGPQRFSDFTTWVYSTNPALCTRDFLTDPLGLGDEQTRIDDVLCSVAANKCDETLTVPIPVLVGLTNWTAGSALVVGTNTAFRAALLVNGYLLAPDATMRQILTVDSDVQVTLHGVYSSPTIGAQITQFNNSGTGLTATQRRYTCNTLLDSTARFEDNKQQLANAMQGTCVYSGGKWRMTAGSWPGSVFSLNEDDLIGGVSVQCSTPRQSLYNAVRGNFIDPQQNYQPNEFPAILNSTYEGQDGERIFTETHYACCTDRYECQRNAMVLSRQSRNRRIVTTQFGMSAFRVQVSDIGTVTIAEVGWVNQTVRCTSWKFYPAGVIEMVLQEAYAADWTDPLLSEYQTTGVNVGPPPGAYLPYPPTALGVAAVPGGLEFTTVLPDQVIPGTAIELWEYTASTPFSSATQIWSGSSTRFFIPKNDTITRYYWVRTRGPNNQVSPTYPPSIGVGAAAGTGLVGPAGPTGPTGSTGSAGATGSTGTAGSAGTPGTDAITFSLTRAAVSLLAYGDGTVITYNDAHGVANVWAGIIDVTSTAALSVSAQVNCVGTINTAVNTPVSGHPKGYYQVTSLTGDVGVLTVQAVYAGATRTMDFTLSRMLTGVEIVAVLPTTNLFQGRVVFLSSDNKLYRYTGSLWSLAVAATDITGLLTDAQLAAIAAAKVTGQLVAGQLAAGSVVAGNIAASVVTATELAANSVTAAAIAANAVTANAILAGIITAAKMSTGTITAASGILAAAAITNATIGNLEVDNAKIANLTIGTGKIAANAVTSVGSGTASPGAYTSGAVISFSMTTQGGPVLLVGQLIGNYVTNLAVSINNGATFLDGYTYAYSGSIPLNFKFAGLFFLATLAAGTYTFILTQNASINVTQTGFLVALEFKK